MVRINHLIASLLISLIRIYQYAFSALFGTCCRFEPSCSSYAIVAIKTHGLWRAFRLIIFRLLRCHPWHNGGFDPVP